MRRKDREMDRNFALEVLDICEYAVLATVNPDGTPYCIPISIVREKDFVYFHCAQQGQKIENLHWSPTVCLTAVGATQIPPDTFTTEYESAVVFGVAEEVTDDAEKRRALWQLCRKYVPTNMEAFNDAVEKSLFRTAVWKIHLETVSGKRKKYNAEGKEMTWKKTPSSGSE